jgi:hypothetical protein
LHFVLIVLLLRGICHGLRWRPSALALPFVEPTGYGLGKSGWITAKLDRDDEVPPAVVRQWIAESFANVAPKSLLKQLDQSAVATKNAKPAKRSGVARADGVMLGEAGDPEQLAQD